MNSHAALHSRRSNAAPALPVTISTPARARVLRHSRWDALLVGLALAQGALLLLAPSVPLIALGLWWNANTVSHNFVHLPFFRSRAANAGFSGYLSLLLGFPQSLWAARHLAHHRGEPFRWKAVGRAWLPEGVLVLALWTGMLVVAPRFLLAVYLPGWLLGLVLCQLQGYFEHARGTVSHYGWLYNWIFFNDGYHVEHHSRPARHWTALSESRETTEPNVSFWPAVLRWLELLSLDGLEELVCHSAWLQRHLVRVHERALARLLAKMPRPGRIVIVGGALFPRTALALRRLVPEAVLTIVDMRGDRIEKARRWLDESVEFVRGFCTVENLPALAGPADVVVVPLALCGRKAEFYRRPPAPHLLVHDWLWRPRGDSTVVSVALLKRLNLVSSSFQSAPTDIVQPHTRRATPSPLNGLRAQPRRETSPSLAGVRGERETKPVYAYTDSVPESFRESFRSRPGISRTSPSVPLPVVGRAKNA